MNGRGLPYYNICKSKLISWALQLTTRERYIGLGSLVIIFAVLNYSTCRYLEFYYQRLHERLLQLNNKKQILLKQKVQFKENESLIAQLEIGVKEKVQLKPVECLFDLVNKNNVTLYSFSQNKNFMKEKNECTESSMILQGSLLHLFNFIQNLDEADQQFSYNRIEIKSLQEHYMATIRYSTSKVDFT